MKLHGKIMILILSVTGLLASLSAVAGYGRLAT